MSVFIDMNIFEHGNKGRTLGSAEFVHDRPDTLDLLSIAVASIQ